ncbi:MAG: NAD(P)/FAD-dependent oxidoreductase [Lentimicrobium sp.]|nr:NAD(P)/FAD-dependent oxidoreductase [Lentimicrobium sp.]
MAELCCVYPFVIKQVGGFKSSMATTGGISLNEINPSTVESLIVRNLYLCGEVIDIDCDTGGYNIQAAMSTAWLAAIDINKKAGA